MANDKVCIFCGEKPKMFRSETVYVGGTEQLCCKGCAGELSGLSEEELCRRALRLGLAEYPEKIEERITLLTESEDHRPACLRCGSKLKFGAVQALDNSPMRDGIFSGTFNVLPAYCQSCGKIEFYNPGYVYENKFIAWLIKKDTEG